MTLDSSKNEKSLNLVEDSEANHVREMAEYFNAELDESNDASTITMDNGKAKGFISSYRIFNGLTVWVYNIKFHSDFKVVLGLTENRPYYFSNNVEGHFLHRFGDYKKFTEVLQNQNMIVRGSPESCVQIVFPADVDLKIAVIILDLTLLENLEIRNAKKIATKMHEVFDKIPSEKHYRYLGGIDVQTKKFASIVCENNDLDIVGSLLTEGAVFNMLASQIHAFSENNPSERSPLSAVELSKITSLAKYASNNFETSLTLRTLSRHFGMSPKKLQAGVKHLYGDSVGRYVLSLRMGHAIHLFNTTNFNVAEVCRRVGIANGGYFSKVFKKTYGQLPSHYTR
jgi:AraC-like DNA-binding protein